MPIYMQEKFGSWQVGDDESKGKVEFKIFFPDANVDPGQYDKTGKPMNYGNPEIRSIQVMGDFQTCLGQVAWDKASAPQMTKAAHSKGHVWSYTTAVELPKGFYEYQYLATFDDGTQRNVSDPCARYGGSRNLEQASANFRENLNAGIVVGGRDLTTTPLASGRKHLRDLVVYELNLDDFTDEYRLDRAALDAAKDKLAHIEDLGFNAILVMPWTAWPGTGFNWGYEPFLYFAVAHRYAHDIAKPAEKLSYLKEFINACHQKGIHVIMDGVFNHVSGNERFPYRLFYKDPDNSPYTGQFGGAFPGLTDLNFNNSCTEEYVRDVCFYWMDDFGIDGIRFDNTTNFFNWSNYNDRAFDVRGLPNLVSAINTHAADPNFSTILEYIDMSASLVANAVNATSYWNNAMFGFAFDYLFNDAIHSGIMNALDSKKGLIGERVATTYLTNHDHSHLAWQAGAKTNDGARLWYRTQPLVIAQLTAPGCPMILNGQEFAEDYWVVEDDLGSGRRVQPRPLRWSYADDKFGKALSAVYKKLIAIRHSYPGLRSDNVYPINWSGETFDPEGYGVDRDKGTAIFHRWGNGSDGKLQRFMIVLNFSNDKQAVSVPFPSNGDWTNLIDDRVVQVNNFRLDVEIESHWGRVFFQG